jgi:hypothetical protein
VEVIDRIARALAAGEHFYALNQARRCVPSDRGFVDDEFDVRSGLRRVFEEEDFHRLPESVTTPELAAMSMVQVLRKCDVTRQSSHLDWPFRFIADPRIDSLGLSTYCFIEDLFPRRDVPR